MGSSLGDVINYANFMFYDQDPADINAPSDGPKLHNYE